MLAADMWRWGPMLLLLYICVRTRTHVVVSSLYFQNLLSYVEEGGILLSVT